MPPLVVALLGTTLPGFSQTFLAEWTAAGNGGVAPTGMALAVESGTTFLYVSDHPRGRILKFNASTGAVAAVLGSPGSGNGQFSQPYGIAIEPATGDLYVAERGNHRVQRITRTGTFVMAWGGLGAAPGQFNEPIGVALDAAGDIYVTEHTNHRVQKFRVTSAGGTWTAAPLAQWGSLGAGNGQFNTPYGIATDSAGNVLVADGFNGRVQKFSNAGVYQSTIGAAGTGPGQMKVATGVTLDPAGAIHVTSTNADPLNAAAADASSQWLSKFSSTGTFISRVGGVNGGGPLQFRLPFSSVVTANRAYVADFGNNRVQVLDLAASTTDTTAPTIVSFTPGTPGAGTVNFTLTFSEAVTGLDAADVSATTTGGATATIGAITGTGATRTIPVTFTGTGTIALTVAGGATANIQDAAGNVFAGGTGATSTVFTIPTGSTDTTAPTVNITVGSSTASSVTFNVAFSESVTGGAAAAFTATGAGGATGVAIASVTPDAMTPTISYSVAVNYTGTAGMVTLAMSPAANTTIKDASNNFFAGAATSGGAITRTHTIASTGGGGTGGDTTRPTITSFELDTASATASTARMVVTFSEPVTGVDQTDFEVKGTPTAAATITGVTPGATAASYNVAFNYTGTSGSLQMAIKTSGTGIADAAGNAFVGGGIAASPAYPVNNAPPSDMTLPTASSFSTPTGTIASPVNLALVFSEAVTGLTADDFVASAGATIGAITGSGTTWTVPVSFTGTTPVSVMVVGGATSNIRDAATHWFAGGSTSATVTFTPGSAGGGTGGGGGGTGGADTTAPTVASFTKTASTATSVTYQITFSESVTGVNSADFEVATTGGATATIGTTTGSGTTYSVAVTFTGTTGTVQLKLKSSGTGITDAAGNALAGGASGPIHTIGSNSGSGGGDSGKGSGPVVVIKRGDGLLAGQPFTLPATTSSGQPITWILVSGNATLNGNVLTPKNKGSVVVRAVVAGVNSGKGVVDYKIEHDDDDDDGDDDDDDDRDDDDDDKKGKKPEKRKEKAPHRDRLSNLSSRLRVSSNDSSRSAIAGFVVSGNSTKQVLIRAVGPGLAAFGVNDAVPSARVQLHDQSGAVIAQNDGWKADDAMMAAFERVGAFKFAAGSRDSALLITLRPGAYTAQVGASGSGITLLEVYDATSAAEASTEQLINISTRGYVDSGDAALIAGFVVTGDAPKRVLVRGIGAALRGFGVAGALSDPVLELYNAGGTTVLARNDDWQNAQRVTAPAATAAEISLASTATGAFPLANGSKDAAILVTLMPGSYSAVVRGANGATGAGLVEVYEVPNP